MRLRWCLALAVLIVGYPAYGDEGEAALAEITVVASAASAMTAASAGDVSREVILSEPLLRPAAILEKVPGLIVTQHSGEGKANQYFLRAFNLDHGTDLAIEVDNVPVNMPSHAHGQGYADLNFLIPELVDALHYKKGPYYADEGDFATAGATRIGLLDTLPALLSTGFGEDGYRRALALGAVDLSGGTLLGAGEVYHNDGPFNVPDDYDRLNGVLRFSKGARDDRFSVTAMAYSGTWNSTDQVPERALGEGLIERFGSLNPTDGGNSSRYSLAINRAKDDASGQLQLSAYVVRYKLELWSTFTYFLKDPLNGDQMLQRDDRIIYGLKASKSWRTELFGLPMTNLVGLQARVDDVRDVGIFPTVDRHLIGTTQDARVRESSGALYAENRLQLSPHVQSVLGIREDVFEFSATDKMRNPDGTCTVSSDPEGCVDGSRRAHLLSPKWGIVLGPWGETTAYLNAGEGYHSNDARGINRSEAASISKVTPMTRAIGAEIGLRTHITPKWQSSLDLFKLKLRSELVFDGDAGVTSPNGSSTRTGIEWANTYAINDWLRAELNGSLTRARFDSNYDPDDLGCGDAGAAHPCAADVGVVGRYIPNSPTNVVDAALSAHHPNGVFGMLRARHVGSSPLVEDNRVKSAAYTTLDAQFGYERSNWRVGVEVFNLADVKWNDIEYYYVSRLKNESSPEADRVVHPGVPRTVRARFEYRF